MLPFLTMLLAGALQSVAASAPQAPSAPAGHPAIPAYVPNRVYDTKTGAFIDFEVMLASIAKVDAVFLGEQHGDPNTHRLEAAVLEGLHRRNVTPIVSLEMFERDVQGAMDSYLAGRSPEDEFLKTSRPWARYASDYRPLVETAKQREWTVLAANVPRRIASAVAKSGKDALAQLSDADRPFVARDLQCPFDRYFERFAETMTGHPGATQTADEKRAMTERYYWAQCVKDETMAESIVAALEKRTGSEVVVHYNGAFHSDFALGAVERVRRRAPGKRTIVVSILPVPDLDSLAPGGEDLKRADYLVFTTSTSKLQLPTPKLF